MLSGFTRLPLDLPRRGHPMPKNRVRTVNSGSYAQMRDWREPLDVWSAALALRHAGHQVFRISTNYHLVDNEPIHTKTLLARASQPQEGHHGQGTEKGVEQEKGKDQERAQPAVP